MSELTHEWIMSALLECEASLDGTGGDGMLEVIRKALEWRPIDELPDNPPDGMWIELAGPSDRGVRESFDSEWRSNHNWCSKKMLIRQGTYTHWRFALPGIRSS